VEFGDQVIACLARYRGIGGREPLSETVTD
jgi:hypothetical protein